MKNIIDLAMNLKTKCATGSASAAMQMKYTSNVHRDQRSRLYQHRRGLSLIEILVSMFILAVGLLSIASLLPVAQNQISKADFEDRKAMVGQNAFRDFKIRGYASPASWVAVDKDDKYTSVASGSTVLSEPIIIDPLLIAGSPPSDSGSPKTKTHQFPYDESYTWVATSATPSGLKRYSLLNVPGKTGTLNKANDVLTYAGAEGVFMSRDELVIEPPKTPEGAPSQQTDKDSSSNVTNRTFEGNYTWMAMLAPAFPETLNTPYDGRQCTLSIIVLYKRSTSQLYDGTTPKIFYERQVVVGNFDGGGIGGGEVKIETYGTSSPQNEAKNLLVKPGEWLLLLSNDKKVAKWYKILNADKFDPATATKVGTKYERHITLAGQDWPSNYQTASTVTAIIVEGAVGVYTKSIKLEGQTMWSWW